MEREPSARQERRADQIVIETASSTHDNLRRGALYEHAIRRREGLLANTGGLIVETGEHTGRSPKDKYVVREPSSSDQIWWGDINQPLSEEQFSGLYEQMLAYFQGRDVFVQDLYACADPAYRIRLRVITETAWHSLFARTLFIRPQRSEPENFEPDFTILHAPHFRASPKRDGTRSDVFVIINFARRLLLIGGTAYAGEIKKSIFTVLNYLLPQQDVLSMHCSANEGKKGDVALFFGLSGTGKTSLGTDPERPIIGDDEHGWSGHGIFNFEGGLYAKVINLSSTAEPQIWAATNRFGATLENVIVDPITREIDFGNASLTENTRAAFPIDFVPNADPDGMGGHPHHIVFLTADAFGVLPPVARLSHEQAMYHFLSGYTAKVAGTESGLTPEPQATFSACFAAPFLPLRPTVYAEMLGSKTTRHRVQCWLVNTGWIGGPYGVGHRISIAYSRAIIHAILSGSLNKAAMWVDPTFRFTVPEQCPGVPAELLHPRQTWQNTTAYDAQAHQLARRFQANFRQFAGEIAPDVREAGPKVT